MTIFKNNILRIIIWIIVAAGLFLFLNTYFLWFPKLIKHTQFLLARSGPIDIKLNKPFVVFLGEEAKTKYCGIDFKLESMERDNSCRNCGFPGMVYAKNFNRDVFYQDTFSICYASEFQEEKSIIQSADYRITLLGTDNKTYVKLLAEKPYTKISQCRDIPQEYEKCLSDVMIKNPQISVCDNMKNISFKNLCYTNIAAAKKDGEICAKINDDLQRNKCYFGVVENGGDVGEWCKKVVNLPDKQWSQDSCCAILFLGTKHGSYMMPDGSCF